MTTEELEIKVAGITFLVTLSVDEDENIDQVENVYIYDHTNRCYVDTNADVDEFYNYFEDYINEAHDNHIESRAEIAAEMRYDAMKEEGLI